MKHFILALCAMMVLFVLSAQEVRADSCPVRLDYAGLVGLGRTHGTAEYDLVFARNQSNDTGPFELNVAATLVNGSRAYFVVRNAWTGVPTTVIDSSTGSMWVYPFAVEVQSFQIGSARDAQGIFMCGEDPDAGYVVDAHGSPPGVSFDDGPNTPWPIEDAGAIEIVNADFITKMQPDYPPGARDSGIQGDVSILVAIDPDGSVLEASIYASSGNDQLDQASLAAARGSTFKPARLSKTLGGASILSTYLIVYSYDLQ